MLKALVPPKVSNPLSVCKLKVPLLTKLPAPGKPMLSVPEIIVKLLVLVNSTPTFTDQRQRPMR